MRRACRSPWSAARRRNTVGRPCATAQWTVDLIPWTSWREGSRALPRLRGMWLLVDLLLVGVFAVVGRISHYGSLTLGGWWTTAWPFLVGTVVAWALLTAARRPPAAIVSGLVIWLGAL